MRRSPVTDQQLNRTIKFLAIALLGLAVLFMALQFAGLWTWILSAIRSVIIPVAMAYIVALIVFPMIKYLEFKGIGPRWLSMAIVLVISVAIIAAAFFFLTPLVIQEVNNFFTNDFQGIITYLTVDLRDEFILGRDIYDQIYNYIASTDLAANFLTSIIPGAIAYMSSAVLPIVTSIAIVPMLLIYYLLDYEMISDRLRSIVPQRHEKKVADLGSRLNRTVGAYLRGQLGLMIALGTIATLVYSLLKIKYAIVFGLIIGLTNIIPYFGSIIAAIPPLIYAFISREVNPLLILAINFGLQMVEGNIFQPLIMGHQLEMHPIIIIVSILFFGSLFGALGVIFASPIAASIRVFYQFYKENRPKKAPLAQGPPGGSSG